MTCSSSLPTYDSVETRDRIFGQGYVFLSFAKNMGKYMGKCKFKEYIHSKTS